LAEAYRYAFDRTVSATAMMAVGAQHPSYDYRLSGQGELVLSSLVKPSAMLVLPEGADRSMVTDLSRDQVVVEVPAGQAREIAVAPGTYGLRLFKAGQSWGGRVVLPEGARKSIRWEELTPMTSSVVIAAKGGPTTLVEPHVEISAPEDRMVLTASIGGLLGVPQQVSPTDPLSTRRDLDGMLRVGFEPRQGPGLAFSVLGSTSFAASSGVHARIGFRWAWELGPVWLSLGAEAGPAFLWQVSPAGLNSTLAGAFAPRAGARLKLGGPFWLAIDGDLSVLLLRLDNKLDVLVTPTFGVGVAFAF
jgi:hypothetical protein